MEGAEVQRILCLADVHLMHDPQFLRPDQLRWIWQPTLTDHRWVPLPLLRAVTHYFRRTAFMGFTGTGEWLRSNPCDGLITVGDQLHGVQDRGIDGVQGRLVAAEFRALCDGLGVPTLFHVPSEHPLGFWDGEDYYPTLVWKHGLPQVMGKPVRHGRKGGALNAGAIQNWLAVFGALWGSCQVEGLTFVWLDCDLLRWHDRIVASRDLVLINLLGQQRSFLHVMLGEASKGSVVLFTHRLEYAYSDPVNQFTNRLHAVVFGDYHDARRAQKMVARYPDLDFHRYFVPALWDILPSRRTQGFGVLTVDGTRTAFQSYNLNGLPLG